MNQPNVEKIPEFTFDNKYTKDQIHISLDKKEQWFLIGYYVRNGSLQSEMWHDINFAMSNIQGYENEILDKIGSILPITFQNCSTGKCTSFGSYNNLPRNCPTNFIWYSILKEFGKDKWGKIIPEWVHNAPKEFIQEFIAGYVKSDICLITDSFDIAFSIQRLYAKLDILYSITITPVKKGSEEELYLKKKINKDDKDDIKFSIYIHPPKQKLN